MDYQCLVCTASRKSFSQGKYIEELHLKEACNVAYNQSNYSLSYPNICSPAVLNSTFICMHGSFNYYAWISYLLLIGHLIIVCGSFYYYTRVI